MGHFIWVQSDACKNKKKNIEGGKLNLLKFGVLVQKQLKADSGLVSATKLDLILEEEDKKLLFHLVVE